MDYSNLTVVQLRSMLFSAGIQIPGTYLKKADLVEMCQKHFSNGPHTSNMPASSRGRSTSGSRKSSSSPERPSRRPSTSARRKSSMGTKGNRPTSPAREYTRSPARTPLLKPADVSDIQDFRRTPSPEAKTFSGRPSLSAPQGGVKKISIAPLSTLPPRPKSFGKKPVETKSSRMRLFLLFLVPALAAVVYLVLNASANARVPLCNTDKTAHVANATCAPCPSLGQCANGYLTSCAEHYVVRGDQCVRDEAKFMNAVNMIDSISTRLIALKGQKDCGEDVSETLYPEQLRVILRMEYRHLTDDQFRSAFDLALNGEKDGVVMPKYIITTPLGLMRSTFGKKTMSCQVREFVQEWIITIILSVISTLYLLVKLLVWRKKRNLEKSLVSAIETNTSYRDGRVQGLSVLDLRDKGMPLHHMDDTSARRTLAMLLKKHPDIQSGEELTRAGETVYWSAHKFRAEQAAHRS